MLVVDHYNYLPGACGLCRSSNLPTIDTNVDLDWPNTPDAPNPSANHRLYICADCCINLAMMVKESRNIEIVVADSYKLLQTVNQKLSDKNINLYTRINELEAALTVVREINKASIVVEESLSPDAASFKVATPKKAAK